MHSKEVEIFKSDGSKIKATLHVVANEYTQEESVRRGSNNSGLVISVDDQYLISYIVTEFERKVLEFAYNQIIQGKRSAYFSVNDIGFELNVTGNIIILKRFGNVTGRKVKLYSEVEWGEITVNKITMGLVYPEGFDYWDNKRQNEWYNENNFLAYFQAIVRHPKITTDLTSTI